MTEPTPEAQPEPTKAPTLEELLADLDDDRRKVVLGQVTKARDEAKNLRTRLKDLEPKAAELDRLAQASQTDAERAQEALKAAETRAQGLVSRTVKAEVKALAASDFAEPADAYAFLDLASYVDTDGEVDSTAIERDLKDLLERKPYLARVTEPAGSRTPLPDRSQGSSGNGGTAADPAKAFASFIRTQMGS